MADIAQLVERKFVALEVRGSKPLIRPIIFGRMAERLKAHDWKSCILYGIGGSNPPSSARIKSFL